MTTTGTKRRRFTWEQRRRIVESWRRSGLSQGRFAREHGIPASYLSRWKTEVPESTEACDGQLVPVRVIDDPIERVVRGSRAFEVRLPSGIELVIPARFERDVLDELLAVLGRARC